VPALRHRVLIAVVVLLAAVTLQCHGEQELTSACLETPGLCPACATDQDCQIVSNSCLSHAACGDRRVPLSVIQIGCTLGYDVPRPDRCVCRNRLCQAR
jgi:hypothetical protein